MATYKVGNSAVGKRVDAFLAAQLPKLGRGFIQKLCLDGKVRVNDEASEPSHKLHDGDKVTVDYVHTTRAIPAVALPIIYEDESCLVIDKPAGVLSHSKGVFNLEATVASFIKPKLQDLEGERAGIVHRLDRATSGVMICAKNSAANSWLQKQFSARKVKKHYIAIVEGVFDEPEALIDMPIERHPRRPQTFRVTHGGKPAQTRYKTLKTFVKGEQTYSMVDFMPQTGRTHQLRVHAAHLKHPIVGDTFYGGQPAERLYLHATSLEITLPSRKRQVFTSPVPASFKSFAGVDNAA